MTTELHRSSFVIVCASLVLAASPALKASSLWTAPGATERPMYADRKAARPGDIVTLVVSESALQSSSQSKSTTTDSSVDASVTQFLFSAAASKFGTKNGEFPAPKFGGKSSSSGGGAVSNTQTVTARAAVLVTDVLPNGNLVIEGVRRVTYSGETQHIVLHGLIRPDDILPDNTILSSNVANARLEFISEGDLTDAGKKGWISKLYERLRPF